MFAAFVTLLLVAWATGHATSHTGGGLIDLLLVAAVALVFMKVIRDREPA